MMGRPAALGAMGIHFFRPDLLGITKPPSPRVSGTGTHTDFRQPSILIYEPKADGSLELVAVENLVFADAWRAAGHAERPTFHGVPDDAMADDPSTALDEAHMFEPHFDRHVWIYRENPNGVFTPFNPAVTCAAHQAAKIYSHHGGPHRCGPRLRANCLRPGLSRQLHCVGWPAQQACTKIRLLIASMVISLIQRSRRHRSLRDCCLPVPTI